MPSRGEIISSNGLPASEDELKDAGRFAWVAERNGRVWTTKEAFERWEALSEDYDAGWMAMPNDDRGLWEMWRRFETRMMGPDKEYMTGKKVRRSSTP